MIVRFSTFAGRFHPVTKITYHPYTKKPGVRTGKDFATSTKYTGAVVIQRVSKLTEYFSLLSETAGSLAYLSRTDPMGSVAQKINTSALPRDGATTVRYRLLKPRRDLSRVEFKPDVIHYLPEAPDTEPTLPQTACDQSSQAQPRPHSGGTAGSKCKSTVQRIRLRRAVFRLACLTHLGNHVF